MYIQITTRCNMKCAHCSQAATEDGEDMTMKVFKKAIKLNYSNKIIYTLGGGEPTIHPQFIEMLEYALVERKKRKINLSIVTNGSIAGISLYLAELASKGIIAAGLSLDQYHKPIHPDVLEAFAKPKKSQYDLREIKLTTEINSAGRGTNIVGAVDLCKCADVIIKPDGRIFVCGCEEKGCGTVWQPKVPNCAGTKLRSFYGHILEDMYCSVRGSIFDYELSQKTTEEIEQLKNELYQEYQQRLAVNI